MDIRKLMQQRWRNLALTALILGGLGSLFAALGWMVAGLEGLMGAVCAGALGLALEQRAAGVLLRKYFGARPIPPALAPELYGLALELSERAGLPRPPRLYYLPHAAARALATGSEGDPAIAVSDGLLRLLSPRELATVLAHEIWHIRQYDLNMMRLCLGAVRLTQSLALAGYFYYLSVLPITTAGEIKVPISALVLLAVAPMVSLLLWLGLSRTREFDADAGAALLTGDPQALASALTRLQAAAGSPWERFGRSIPAWARWLDTHPTAEERIARLKELAPPPREGLPAALIYLLDRLWGPGFPENGHAA